MPAAGGCELVAVSRLRSFCRRELRRRAALGAALGRGAKTVAASWATAVQLARPESAAQRQRARFPPSTRSRLRLSVAHKGETLQSGCAPIWHTALSSRSSERSMYEDSQKKMIR